jgi:hypothetical protein
VPCFGFHLTMGVIPSIITNRNSIFSGQIKIKIIPGSLSCRKQLRPLEPMHSCITLEYLCTDIYISFFQKLGGGVIMEIDHRGF